MRQLGLAAIVLVGAGGLLSGFSEAVESAAVKIGVPARYVQATPSAHGSIAGGQFRTQRLQVQLTESAAGSATGVARTAATYASGYVVFNHSCPSVNPTCPGAPTKPGYEVCYINPAGGALCYVLQATISCFCGERVPVRARGPGSTFNIAPHSVTYLGWADPWVTVDNPDWITGGTDPTSSPVVQQSDLDAVRTTLAAQLTSDLDAALEAKAQTLHYMVDGAPTLSVSSDVNAGTHASSFQVTISGTLAATAFADADAMATLAGSMTAEVPPGYRLGAAPALIDYQVVDSNAQGEVTVRAKVVGLVLREISAQQLRSMLRGVTPGAAVEAIRSLAPGSNVEIRLSPVTAPLLPMNAGHITIDVVTAGT